MDGCELLVGLIIVEASGLDAPLPLPFPLPEVPTGASSVLSGGAVPVGILSVNDSEPIPLDEIGVELAASAAPDPFILLSGDSVGTLDGATPEPMFPVIGFSLLLPVEYGEEL